MNRVVCVMAMIMLCMSLGVIASNGFSIDGYVPDMTPKSYVLSIDDIGWIVLATAVASVIGIVFRGMWRKKRR
jgi:hypothetical protein